MIAIKYIGRHPEHKESLYGTGVSFKKDEVKLFSEEIASKLLKHTDTYALEEIKQDAKLKKLEVVEELKPDDEEYDRVQEALNAKKTISRMTDAQLKAYAATKFNHNFDEKSTIPEMKRYLIDKINIGVM